MMPGRCVSILALVATALGGSFHSDVGPMDLSWSFPTDDTIEMELTLPSAHYVGIGLTADGVGDTIAGWVKDGQVHVGDYWDAGQVEPETDVSKGCRNDVTAISGSKSDTGTTIRFSRKLNTGDKDGCDVTIVKGKMDIVYAWCENERCADAQGECQGFKDGCIDMPHDPGSMNSVTVDFSAETRNDDLVVV